MDGILKRLNSNAAEPVKHEREVDGAPGFVIETKETSYGNIGLRQNRLLYRTFSEAIDVTRHSEAIEATHEDQVMSLELEITHIHESSDGKVGETFGIFDNEEALIAIPEACPPDEGYTYAIKRDIYHTDANSLVRSFSLSRQHTDELRKFVDLNGHFDYMDEFSVTRIDSISRLLSK